MRSLAHASRSGLVGSYTRREIRWIPGDVATKVSAMVVRSMPVPECHHSNANALCSGSKEESALNTTASPVVAQSVPEGLIRAIGSRRDFGGGGGGGGGGAEPARRPCRTRGGAGRAGGPLPPRGLPPSPGGGHTPPPPR